MVTVRVTARATVARAIITRVTLNHLRIGTQTSAHTHTHMAGKQGGGQASWRQRERERNAPRRFPPLLWAACSHDRTKGHPVQVYPCFLIARQKVSGKIDEKIVRTCRTRAVALRRYIQHSSHCPPTRRLPRRRRNPAQISTYKHQHTLAQCYCTHTHTCTYAHIRVHAQTTGRRACTTA